MATHSPVLMAYPNATLLEIHQIWAGADHGQTYHYRALQEFFYDPRGFVEAAIGEVELEERVMDG